MRVSMTLGPPCWVGDLCACSPSHRGLPHPPAKEAYHSVCEQICNFYVNPWPSRTPRGFSLCVMMMLTFMMLYLLIPVLFDSMVKTLQSKLVTGSILFVGHAQHKQAITEAAEGNFTRGGGRNWSNVLIPMRVRHWGGSRGIPPRTWGGGLKDISAPTTFKPRRAGAPPPVPPPMPFGRCCYFCSKYPSSVPQITSDGLNLQPHSESLKQLRLA